MSALRHGKFNCRMHPVGMHSKFSCHNFDEVPIYLNRMVTTWPAGVTLAALNPAEGIVYKLCLTCDGLEI
jgi:hypothetical protein